MKKILSIILHPFFKKWIAGRSIETAIFEVKKANALGGKGIINFLGERHADQKNVNETVKEYNNLLEAIARAQLQEPLFKTSISFKVSQFGFDVKEKNVNGKQLAFENIHALTKKALTYGVEVEIDSEESEYTEFTLDCYKKLLAEFHGGVKLCMQSNLVRTEKDLDEVIKVAQQNRLHAPIRIVKGVYPEKQNNYAYQTETQKVENFKRIIRMAFENSTFLDISIGTHRQDIIELAQNLSQEKMVPFELQMLKGIKEDLQKEFLQKQSITIYIPYGQDSFDYCIRRMKKG